MYIRHTTPYTKAGACISDMPLHSSIIFQKEKAVICPRQGVRIERRPAICPRQGANWDESSLLSLRSVAHFTFVLVPLHPKGADHF